MKRIDKRSTLRQGQIDILRILYKYRFSSRQLLADSLHIAAGSNLYEKLNVLMRHKLVARRYNARLKLQGIPAAYYLTPKGFKTAVSVLQIEQSGQATATKSLGKRSSTILLLYINIQIR